MRESTNTYLQAVRMLDAIRGIVSENFRYIWMTQEFPYEFVFVLENEDDADREEISDAVAIYDSMQNENFEYSDKILVSSGAIDIPTWETAIFLFQRKRQPA